MPINEPRPFMSDATAYFLTNDGARYYADKANVTVWLVDFAQKVAEQTHDSANLLSVAVVGEFKAGKSTLINALIGREVAYVDAFEATTAVAVISPGADEKVVITDAAGNHTNMTIERFIDACRRRTLRDVGRLEMTVRYDLPFLLIDTPGMGSSTTVNEERAEDAIMSSADTVLWIMDPSDMLSAKEAGFLTRARHIGLPIWCVLSKADELSDSEVEECIDCVMRTTGLPRGDILALSAHNQIASGSDPGVRKLIARLRQQCEQFGAVRLQGEDAKVTESLSTLENAVRLIAASLQTDVEWLAGEHAVFTQEAQIVRSTLLRDTKSFLADSALRYFSGKITALEAAHTPADTIPKILLEGYANEVLPTISAQIATRVHEKAISVWDGSFQDRQSDLRRQIENLARNEMENGSSEQFLHEQLVITELRRTAVGMGFRMVPAVIGATIFTVLLGPAGVLAHLLAMSAGAAMGHMTGGSSGSKAATTTTEAHFSSQALAEFAHRMAESIVDRILEANITSYIEQVSLQALDERCRQRTNGLHESAIRAVDAKVQSIGQDLHALSLARGFTQSERPASSRAQPADPAQAAPDPASGAPPREYASETRVQLTRFLEQNGSAICQSPRRVEGFLKDMCSANKIEIHLLMLCLSSGVVADILRLQALTPAPLIIESQAKEMAQNTATDMDAARWAVESWVEALCQSAVVAP